MAGPYPLASISCRIDANGISAPPYADILASLQASYRLIYGQDVDLAPDTQDGQLIAIQASAQDDSNQNVIAVYNGFSPTFAQGAGLSSLVKINGLRRHSDSFSTATLLLVGQAQTFIASGIVADGFGNQWTLPPNTVIPLSGEITVTGTCTTPGAVAAAAGTITQFVTIVAGWQSVTNTASATPGAPVESDATLRQRQSVSTSLPAQTPLAAIIANVANIAGVQRYAIYNNDQKDPDGNGIPPNSIAVVVEGGDVGTIAQVIADKKNPGTGTYGTTSRVIVDQSGVPEEIDFFELTEVPIYYAVTLTINAAYAQATGQLVMLAVAAAIQGLNIGTTVEYSRLWSAANLSGTAALSVAPGLTQAQLDQLSGTYEVTSLTIGTDPAFLGTRDLPILFNQAAQCTAANGVLSTAT